MKTGDIDKTINAISKALEPLLKKLGLAAEQIFEWAVRQNYVQAITLSLWPIIATICAVVFFRRLSRVFKELEEFKEKTTKDYENYADTIEGAYNIVILVVVGFVGLIAIVVSAMFLQEIVARFANPQWMALQDILRALKN